MFFLIRVLASAANMRAEIWEHASPNPAMHVQCAHRILPLFSAAIQGCSGVAVSLWECLTVAMSNEKH